MIPMTTLRKNPSWKSSPSFALISVLALVSLAALTATAFLASARLERQASSSIGKTTLLEMALNSGKFCVTQIINDYSQTDLGNTAIVTYWRTNWTDELGYPFIAKTKTSGSGNGQDSAMWYYAPLFSPAGLTNLGTNDIQNAMRFTNTHQGTFSNDMRTFMSSNAAKGFTNTPDPGLTNSNCVQIPLLGGRTSPPVAWIYINQEKRKFGTTLTNNSRVVRIAWFTEDLEGLIDAERMGAATDRSTGTQSEEISLSSATGTNGVALVSSTSIFTNKRATYISYGLLATNSGLANSTNAYYFASGLRAWEPTNPASPNNGALAWIPVGIPVRGSSNAPKGYTNQGYTKLNINTLVTISGSDPVAVIASAISNNLPNFRKRSGGMNSNSYISNIAANIVDLFDSDNLPTTRNTDIRGIENYPFVNEIWDRYELTNCTTAGTNFTLTVSYDLKITTWLELWNMSSQAATNGTLRIIYKNRESLTNQIGGTNIPVTFTQRLNYTTNVDLVFTTSPATPLTLTNCRIPANSFHMIPLPTYTNSFTTTITNSTKITNNTNLVLLWRNNGNANAYATYYGSNSSAFPSILVAPHTNLVDASSASSPPDGIQRNPNNTSIHYLSPSHSVWWRGNGTPNSDLTLGLVGDPRMSFHLNSSAGQTWFDHQFEAGRASWWARNTLGAGASNYTVNLSKWPETSHNTTAFANVTNPLADPTTITNAQETNKPVQIIYNRPAGKIMELGQVFDPIQWSYSVTANPGGVPVSGATSNSASGGGNTLRIGRPEHPLFAFTNMYSNSVPPIPNMGMSSAALLDLFCVTNGNSVSGGPYSLGGGKINLNTAPAPVLRALAGGILLSNDVAQLPTKYAIPPAMAEAFAQGVMRFRSKYPFLTPSHLSFIGTDPAWPNTNTWPVNAVFGNTNSITLTNVPGNTFGSTAQMSIAEWNDQAAEEWFSKIYSLSSCQSHNYRIYVVAQLVATNSAGQINPIGPLVKKYYQVFFQNGSAVNYPTNWPTTISTYPNNDISTWTPTGYCTDILQSYY